MNLILEILPSGMFVVMPSSVGMTEAEACCLALGREQDERLAEKASYKLRRAFEALADARIEGHC